MRLLETWFDEPVDTSGLEQFTTSVRDSDGRLEPDGDETVLRRTVLLQGRHSRRTFVYAESDIVLERLPAAIRDALLSTSEPIGRLLSQNRVATFRDFLDAGRSRAGLPALRLGLSDDDEWLFRTYRILVDDRPVMLITEHFPASEVRTPA